MIYPISVRIDNNQRSQQNYQLKTNQTPIQFSGVHVSDEDDENTIKKFSFANNFETSYKAMIKKYNKMKENISGIFFRNKKLRKIEDDRRTALNSYQLSQEDFQRGQEALIASQKETLEMLRKNNANIDEIIDLKKEIDHQIKIKNKIEEIANSKSQNKGFRSLGGYEFEKGILTNLFINYLPKERAGEYVNLPGCILFFGPNGTGKTSFARAFAYSCDCGNVQSISGNGKTKEETEKSFLKNLINAMIKSEENFQKNNIRTILLVDEFDEFSGEESTILPQLKSILENCSDKYHCTIFATTNNPLNIAEEIRGDKRIPIKVDLAPPNFENTVAVLTHYLQDYEHEPLDYDALAKKIISVQPDAAYNNSQLEEICNNAYENANGEITQDDVLYQIDITDPGITKEDLLKFENEKKNINTTGANTYYEK